MSRPHFQTTVCWVLLVLIFLLSLVLRIAVPWDHVFSGNWIKFTDNDAYYYVRLLDNLARHFPFLGSQDPYYIYPGGQDLSGRPLFFVYLMGFIAWLLGGGAPSQHTVDMVAVLFPAVTGALLVIPVFFLGLTIFNKWAGLAAAGFIALMPGEFLVRTLLGNTDSHALEIFLSTLFMLLLLLSVHYGREIALNPLRHENRLAMVKPLVFGALGGFCLGLYLLSWAGALFFVFISFTWLVLQCVSDHLRGRPSLGAGVACFSAFLVALIMVMAWLPGMLSILSLALAAAGSVVLPAVSYMLQRRRANPNYYPALIAFLGIAAVLLLYAVSPPAYTAATAAIGNFFSWQYSSTIAEMQPLLIQQGSFTVDLVWGNYTAASVLALASLAYAVYRAIRRGEPGIGLLAVWSIITLLAALAMRRFAYYLAVDIAVLAGYTAWLILKLCGLQEMPIEFTSETANRKAGRKITANRRRGQRTVANSAKLALGIVSVVALVVYPNSGPLPGGDKPVFNVATRAIFTPSDAWCESLDWLRANTQEPFGNADYYYGTYPAAVTAKGPPAAYSTLCWWDYGYWVSRIGRRVPFSNPGVSDRGDDWRYFMAQTAAGTEELSSRWNMRYVIINGYLVDRDSGFKALMAAGGEPASRYSEIYYRPRQDKLAPTLLYYPEYYRTMAVRLYCYDGRQYIPAETAVISWEDKTGEDGFAYKEITGLKTFSNYPEAEAFTAAQKTGNWRIVGKDPLASPVPLEALANYGLVFASPQKAGVGNTTVPEVKIFQYKQ